MAKEWDKVTPAKRKLIEPFLKTAPVSIVKMAKELGIKVVLADLGPDKAGQILAYSRSESGYKIRVNQKDSYEQQRFTVAHEIAHYLIHEEKIHDGVHDSGLYRSYELSDEQETEANRLAVILLVPKKIATHVLEKFGGKEKPGIVQKMAQQFRVPEWLMRIRLGVDN